MRDAPWMAERRAIAAAAPKPARPSPPANKGLSKRASRPKIECVGPWLDIVGVMRGAFLGKRKMLR